jgi:uncharacterized membrane protein (UPF0127 family)
MNKKGLILFMALILVAAGCNRTQQISSLTIGNKNLTIEIAQTPDERSKGLSNRDSLPENHGMLFDFETSGRHGFWMKDTRFPLDFIWIMDGKVIEITPNVQPQLGVPDQQLITYLPDQPVDMVLEVNAGWVAKNGIKIGDSVIID